MRRETEIRLNRRSEILLTAPCIVLALAWQDAKIGEQAKESKILTDDKLKKLLNSGMLPGILAGGLSIVSLVCMALVRYVDQANALAIFRIVGQLAGYGAFGFGCYGLGGTRKAEKPLQAAALCIVGMVLGILGTTGSGM